MQQRTRIRFRFDERIPGAVARELRRREIDVQTANDLREVGMADEDVLASCLAKGRVLVTFESDFLGFHDEGTLHAGIVYAKPGTRSVGEVIEFLVLVADALSPDDMDGRVQYM